MSRVSRWLGLGRGADSASGGRAGRGVGFTATIGGSSVTFHCERPWVAATKVRVGALKVRSNTAVNGRPLPSGSQVAPVSNER